MAGKSSVKPTNHSDSDENDELFLPPSSTLSFHHAHLRRSEVNQSTAVFRSFSSDLEDDCFHIGLPDGYNAMSGSDVANEKPPLTRQESLMSQSSENEALAHQTRAMRQGSIVDGLLHEIYDHWYGSRRDSFDSDTLTECSSTSEFMWCSRHDIGMYSMDGGYQSSIERRQTGCYTRSFLQTQDVSQLSRILSSIQRLTTVMSARLVRQLKRRDRRLAKRNRNYDVVTAILQAASLKRQIDTRMRFSIAPPQGQPSAFDQWKDAMRAVCRLPMGIPTEFRKKVWLSLADHYLVQLRINWDKTLRFVFNERSNPDDDKLGMQIVKDLHRTGCSNFSGDDNVEDRAILKRVLLAYARWNKRVGYCQGFNVIAALLLNVMDRKEDDALKVMIYLIDSVLPESYFANNLRALSVDMAVFRDLLALTYPRLSKHLDRLQLQAQDVRTGACYEPPLTNVFTMQWFLTLFATCLPVNVVLRVWDSVLLEGSEILLRTALTIWGKLSKRILGVSSADEFYSVMGELSTSIMQGTVMDGDSIIKSIYALGDFPFPNLNELREKYTYNIRPLTPSTSSGVRKVGGRSLIKAMLYSDDDDIDDDDVTAMACMPGEMSSSSSDISVLGPGVYGSGLEPGGGSGRAGDMQMERMSTDINSLKLQYQRLKERQQQAHIIIAAASQKKAQLISSSSSRKPLSSSSSASTRTRGGGILSLPPSILLPSIESPTAMNHLFVGKHKPLSASARNRLVTQGPCISQHAPLQHKTSAVLSKQLQAVANAQAVSKSQRMKTSKSNTKPGDQAPQVTNTKNTPTTQSRHTENTLTLQGNDNNSDDGKPTPKNVSIETVLTPASETSGSAVSVNNLTEDGVDKLSQDKMCDSLGVKDGSKGGDSQDNKSLCDLTPDPVVNKGNPANAASLDSVVVSVPNDLDNDSISDKSVQTCFEVLDSLDSITDLETGQEDSHNNISRGTPQLHTSLCSVSESSTAPDKSNHEMDTRVATHTTVPYVEKGDDNKLVDPSSSLQLSCNKSHQRADDADISPPNPQITYPLNAIDLPSTNPRTSIVREPQDTQHCILSTNILPLPSTVATNLHPGENLPEDSGIDSSSTASPSTTPKRGPKNTYRSDSVDDGIEIHASQDINPHSNGSSKKDDLLLVTTTTTSLSNNVEIAQTKEGDEADVCKSLSPSSSNFEPGLCDENKLSNHDDSSVSSETHVDEADDHRSDKVCCNDSTAEGVSGGNLSTVNRSDSTDPVNDYGDSSYPKDLPSNVEPPSPTTPSLSTITTTTSPQRKFFRRSVSCTVSSPGLIETVPVPENLTGSGSQKQRIKENTTHQKQQTAGSDSSSQESLRNDVHRQDNHSTRKDAKTTGPVNSKSNSLKTGNTPTYSRRLSTPAACHVTSESASKKPFNPFPVKLFNANRAKTGLKLGLYSATTLEQLKGLKSRTTST